MFMIIPKLNQGGTAVASIRHLKCLPKSTNVLVLKNKGENTSVSNELEQYSTRFVGISSFFNFYSLLTKAYSYRKILFGNVVAMHFDSIVFCLIVKALGGRFRLIGYIHTDLEAYLNSLPYLKRKLFSLFLKSFKYLDDVLFLTAHQEKWFKNHYFDVIPTSHVHSLPNPFESTFTNSSTKLIRDSLVYIGRLSKEKNVSFILKSYKLYREKGGLLKLNICGDGENYHDLLTLSHDLGLREYVNFYGYVNDIEDILSRSRLLLLASTVEGFPLVFLEAMNSGNKILTSAFSPACFEIFGETESIGNDVIRENYSIVDIQSGEALELYAERMLELSRSNFSELGSFDCILNKYSYESVRNKWDELLNA
ncbi:glycosyltransferase [Vibrio cyclitrophicus]